MLNLKVQIVTALLIVAALAPATAGRLPTPKHETPEFWTQSARSQLAAAEEKWLQLRYEAKSAILFIGDGMGPTTVTAGRILKGQLAHSSGEEAQLEFDNFPHVGLVKTYSADGQTPDSASTATAFLSGAKTNDGLIGLNQYVNYKNCSSYESDEQNLESFLTLAQRDGRSVGIVTTTRITHATPASAFANSPSRSWESDTDMNPDLSSSEQTEQRSRCKDIATQLIENAINFNVIIGGGREKFLPKTKLTMNHADNKTVKGDRSDNVDLIELWKRRHAEAGRRARYVETTDALLNVDPSSTDHLLGLVAVSHLEYHVTNQAKTGYKQPTLAQMVEVAVKILQKNDKGFLLLVEAGRIDHGHHGNRAQRALHDVVALDDAVGVAKRMTSSDDTLIVVTADHSHVFTLGHYGKRGQKILDKVTSSGDENVLRLARDRLPYTVLHYADGPSARTNAGRRNITNEDLNKNYLFRYQSLVPTSSESHGGEDVGLYAMGPGAHLFTSVQEQSYIAHAVMKAACVGWYRSNNQCLHNIAVTAASSMTAGSLLAVAFVIKAVVSELNSI